MTNLKIDNFIERIKNQKEIDTTKWKEFELGKIFDCDTAKQILKVVEGDFPYITRSSFNNGLTKFVKKIHRFSIHTEKFNSAAIETQQI